MAINPDAPKYREKDVSLLNGFPDLNDSFPAYPEVDIDLLPGVPGQRGPTGPQGPTGPTGPTGPAISEQEILDIVIPAVAYQHTQIAVSDTWIINHNLHFSPNVTAFDSGGTQVEGNVVHLTTDSLTIQFSAAISGNAVLS